MMNKILREIEMKQNFYTIDNFLRHNLSIVEEDGYNEAYATMSMFTYALTPALGIVAKSSFDIFGSSKTGGYNIYVEDVLTGETYPLYTHSYSVYDGIRSDEKIEIYDYKTKNKVLELFEKSNEYTVDGLEKLVKRTSTMVIPYWKNLSNELKNSKVAMNMLCEYMYTAASLKVSEIHNYMKISPYGGMDISYYPLTICEDFVNSMYRKIELFTNKTHSEFNKMIFEFARKQNSKDADEFMKGITQSKKNASLIIKNQAYLKEIVVSYINANRRVSLLERQKDNLMDRLSTTVASLIDAQNSLVRTKRNLDAIPQYGVVSKIFQYGKYLESMEEKDFLLQDVYTLEFDIEHYKEIISIIPKQCDVLDKKIKKIKLLANNEEYKRLTNIFFEEAFGDNASEILFEVFEKGDLKHLDNCQFEDVIASAREQVLQYA